MNNKFFLLSALVGLLFLSSCNDDDDNTSTFDFGTPPTAANVTSGTVEVITEDMVRYHVLVFGNRVTSTIVETETGITIVDVGFTLVPNSGTELRAYADALNKPINIIITHPHRDHYENMDKFPDATVYIETKSAEILLADPTFTDLCSGSVNAVSGSQSIAGLEYTFDNISNTEATENGYIYIPSQKALFPGDLVFDNTHAYIRDYTPLDNNDELETWITVLNTMKADFNNYNHIFMGHNGERTDVGVTIDENIDYLTNAQALIKGTKELTTGGTASTVKEVTDELTVLYPNHELGGLLLALPDGFFPGDPGAVWFEAK